jgi:hypothetical protein
VGGGKGEGGAESCGLRWTRAGLGVLCIMAFLPCVNVYVYVCMYMYMYMHYPVSLMCSCVHLCRDVEDDDE